MVVGSVVHAPMDFEEAIVRLRALRGARPIREIAKASGLKSTAIQNYEAGERTPALPILRKWAAALGERVIFDVVPATTADRAERVAAMIQGMDETHSRLAARLVALAERAEPGQIKAAVAALEAIMVSAGVVLPVELPEDQDVPARP